MPFYRIFRRSAGLLLVGLLLVLTRPAATAQAGGTRDILREITDVVGLKPRFELRATTAVQNAAAVVYDGHRFLLYNPQFVAAVNRAGRTDWAGISILAHEMGHHLNGHTLLPGGSKPADELEADEFSGFVLRKMGASLAEAQAAMALVSDDAPSATHPGRAARLTAISNGWQQSNNQIMASTHTAAPSAAPVQLVSRQPQRPATAEPVSVVGRITFRANPDEAYLLTNQLNVMRVDADNGQTQLVGRLTRSTSPGFPYVLIDGQQRRLYVSSSGAVFNPQGEQVGLLSDPS